MRREHVMLLVLFAAAGVLLALFRPGGSELVPAGVATTLPPSLGDWTGRDRYFCQNPVCLKSVVLDTPPDEDSVCSHCGGNLHPISLGERNILPSDTKIVRKEYVHHEHPRISVTLVASGHEQRSIHRPEQCLPAQGYVIQSKKQLRIPLAGRPPLAVSLFTASIGDQILQRRPALLYWFHAAGRETPYHWQRLWWMAQDRLRGKMQSWAYIMLFTEIQSTDEGHLQYLKEFLGALYPSILPLNK